MQSREDVPTYLVHCYLPHGHSLRDRNPFTRYYPTKALRWWDRRQRTQRSHYYQGLTQTHYPFTPLVKDWICCWWSFLTFRCLQYPFEFKAAPVHCPLTYLILFQDYYSNSAQFNNSFYREGRRLAEVDTGISCDCRIGWAITSSLHWFDCCS